MGIYVNNSKTYTKSQKEYAIPFTGAYLSDFFDCTDQTSSYECLYQAFAGVEGDYAGTASWGCEFKLNAVHSFTDFLHNILFNELKILRVNNIRQLTVYGKGSGEYNTMLEFNYELNALDPDADNFEIQCKGYITNCDKNVMWGWENNFIDFIRKWGPDFIDGVVVVLLK